MGKRYVSWVKLFGTFVEFVDGGISRSSLPFQFYLFIVDFFFLFFFCVTRGGRVCREGCIGKSGGKICVVFLYLRAVQY